MTPTNPSLKRTIIFIVCYLSIMFSGISTMLMSVYLPVVTKDLLGNVSDEKMNNVAAYINSFFLFGSMFGGFAWGYICDKIGRSKSVICCTAFYGLFTVLTAFSDSWMMVGIYRLLTGFGVGGILVTTNILIAESWSGKKKAVTLGIVSAAMPVGFIVVGITNNMLDNWPSAFLTGIIPIVIALISVFILPESENWNRNVAGTSHQSMLIAKLFDRRYRKNLINGSLIFGAMLIGLWAVFSWAPTWVQSVTSDESLAQQLRGSTMMVLAMSGLLGSIASGWIVNAMGLRNTMNMCFAACFVMVFVVFKLNHSVTTITFVEMAVMAFFFGISQGALSVFIPQLFPTVVRATATGFCFNIGRLFTASVVFFIGALVGFLGGYGNAIFTFSFIFIAGLIVTMLSAKEHETFDEEPAGKVPEVVAVHKPVISQQQNLN